MRGLFAVLGALSGAIVVLTGAFGAHGLRNVLDAQALDIWEKANRTWDGAIIPSGWSD